MEERGQSNSTGQHKLILQNRKSGSFTGVTDVVNFDANEIILDTELGRLTIKGKELHVNRLDLQKKEVEIDGKSYTVRVANNTKPEECTRQDFSQTACGFVVEFADIV